MVDNNNDMIIHVGADTSSAEQSFAQLQKEVRNLFSELNKNSSSTKALEKQALVARTLQEAYKGVSKTASESFGKVADTIDQKLSSAEHVVKAVYSEQERVAKASLSEQARAAEEKARQGIAWDKQLEQSSAKKNAAIVASMRQRYAAEDAADKRSYESAKQVNEFRTKQADAQSQAGSAFTAAIKSRMQQEVEAERTIQAERANTVSHLVRMRYALYDVGNAATNVNQQFASALKSIVSSSAGYEQAFTKTEIAAQLYNDAAGAEALRTQLENLSTTLPNAFGDVSNIAALGAALGIANSDLTQFTETVIQFANASNVSTESAAQAFGNLSSLLNLNSSEFKNLGSSIAEVGINSAATETEIIAVMNGIAGVAANANISADYLVGLSATLASLKVPAERSRGALTRVFTEVNTAAANGGPQLQKFADIMGMTAAQTKELASTNMEQFFTTFINGLSGMSSQDLTLALEQLGLSDIRVTDVLSRLSNQTGLFTKTMDLANKSYADGTFLSQAYAAQQDNVSVKFQELVNTINLIIARIGDTIGPTVKVVLDALLGVTKGIAAFLNTGLGAGISIFITGILALGAAITGIVAAVALAAAPFLALKAIMGQLALSEDRTTVAATNLIAKFTGIGLSAEVASMNVRQLTRDLVSASNVNAGAGFTNFMNMFKMGGGGAAAESGFGAGIFGKAITGATKFLGWIGLIITAIQTVQFVADEIGKALQSNFDKGKKSAEDFFGTATGLADAMKTDAANNSQQFSIQLDDASVKSINDARDATDKFTASQNAANGAVAQVGNTIQFSYGEASKKATLDLIQNSQKFQEILNSGMIEKIGGNKQDFITAILGDPVHGAQTYISSLGKALQASANPQTIGMNMATTGMESYQEALTALQPGIDALTGEMTASATATENANIYQAAYNASLDETEVSASAAATSLTAYKDKLGKLSTASKSLDSLAQSIADNGTAFAGAVDASGNYTAEAIANSQALATAIEDSVAAAEAAGMSAVDAATSAVAQSFATMVANGVDAANALSAISAAGYEAYTGALSLATSGTYAGLTNAFNVATAGAKKAGGAVGGTTAKVRTLTDYANDLKNVWSRAFDIRFSGQQALDTISSALQSIAQASQDARDEITGLEADIAGLTADKALQEYFLSVAVAYGDSLKAAEIRANIAKIDSDLTSSTTKLTKAQAKSNKTLSGNSEEAIANRAEILGLVGNYQSYMQSLAASGMSQSDLQAKAAQLKQEFITQATQLGYNSAELGTYASAFDDVATAISNVPRNVTVEANVNPAIQAMNELNAAANSAAAGRTLNVGTSIDYAGLAKFARGVALAKELADLQMAYSKALSSDKHLYIPRMDAIKSQLNSGNFATGGYVSGPGTSTSDSIRANLSNGEYVIRAAAVQKYGAGFFDQLNQMRMPSFASGGLVTSASTGMVSLSPEDRALIRGIGGSGDITLAVDGVTLARAVNNGNQTIVAQGGRI